MADRCYDPERFVAVLDLKKCLHSQTQLEHLKELREAHPDVAPLPVIDCSDERNSTVKLCDTVKAFPAVCDKDAGKCVYGVRKTLDDLEQVCLATRS